MPPSVPNGLLNWPSPKPANRAGSRGPTANTICRCNFRIPGFCSSAVGILIVPAQASILSRCRAPRCDRRPVRPKRNPRKRLENNLRTSGEKIVTRYNGRKGCAEDAIGENPCSQDGNLSGPTGFCSESCSTWKILTRNHGSRSQRDQRPKHTPLRAYSTYGKKTESVQF